MHRIRRVFCFVLTAAAVCCSICEAAKPVPSNPAAGPSIAQYPSIQAALDANPGKRLFVPAGDYAISRAIEIRRDGSGLFGPGRIVQSNPAVEIVRVAGARGVQLHDLTLTRAEGKQSTKRPGLEAEGCQELVLDNLQVLDNHGCVSIRISACSCCQIRNCLVRDYTDFSLEDRTVPNDFGFAFNCIDGAGIQVDNAAATLISGNRVIESRLIATPELARKHELGKIVKRSTKPGASLPDGFQRDSARNWHQGSAIHIANPEVSDYTQVIGNYIENAGQGIDVHADHVVISGNIVTRSFMGMKAMHGARHVQIIGNQFSKIDLWGILLQPGSSSHPGREATAASPARPPNVDGGSIIANNVISDFGYGNEYWNWKDDGCYPIFLQGINDPQYPPLCDVIVTGNVVYDTGRDKVLEDGKLVKQGPRYKYAICIDDSPMAPRGLVVANNIFHPGQNGVSNVDLTQLKAQP